MNKCLKITFDAEVPADFLRSFVQKNAKKCELEGTAQLVDAGEKVRIIVCGAKELVDSFLDMLLRGTSSFAPEAVEVEPFLKDKDYRGVFRVIE